MAVLPFGKSAVISGSMLGLGRALGETMAVAIILSVSGIVTFNLISSGEPVDDRRQHRAQLPRVLGPRRQRPDRLRPRPLRDHPGRQHDRPAVIARPTSSSDRRWLRRPETRTRQAAFDPAEQVAAARRAGRPRRHAAALVPASRRRRARPLIAAGRPARHGQLHDRPARSSLTAVIALPTAYIWSRTVEGRRQAKDRLVTLAIVTGFGLAVLPLLSLLYEVVKRGLHGFDVAFFTESARGVIGAGGGAEHAILGTLVITGVATADLGADRDHGRDLPERVRDGPPAPGAHLLRRRDDRHPVDRRRAVRLRAVRALPRARASGSGSSARSRSRC